MKTILLTGFEPFGDSDVNPSIEACKKLDGNEYNGCKVVVREVPLRYKEIRSCLESHIKETDPSAVICTGLGGGPTINLERVALNLANARIPYNCGDKPVEEPIMEDGPVAYFSTLPLRKMLEAVENVKVPIKISNSAGTFGCNQIFYDLRNHIETNNLDLIGGFIHVPPLPEQAMKRKSASMSLEYIVRALDAVLRATSEVL
jgi:pyroglutamyl-peptidase